MHLWQGPAKSVFFVPLELWLWKSWKFTLSLGFLPQP